MKLSVKDNYQLNDVLHYLGTETTLLNDGRYRTCPDIIQLVLDNNVKTFLEVNTNDSHICHILEEVFHDIKTICVDRAYKSGPRRVKNGSLDMVYFDQAEDFDTTEQALKTWLPKVKKGGIVAGYDQTRYVAAIGPFLAVKNYIDLNDIALEACTNNPNVYWFTK